MPEVEISDQAPAAATADGAPSAAGSDGPIARVTVSDEAVTPDEG